MFGLFADDLSNRKLLQAGAAAAAAAGGGGEFFSSQFVFSILKIWDPGPCFGPSGLDGEYYSVTRRGLPVFVQARLSTKWLVICHVATGAIVLRDRKG